MRDRPERKEICRKADAMPMRSRKPWFSRKWYVEDIHALAFLLLGLAVVLFVAVTGGEYFTWTLWIAVPMIMLSLAYLFLVSALPIFLGPREGDDSSDDRPPEDGR